MAVPTEIFCTACGRAATTADRFCGFCGARLDAEQPTPTDDSHGANRPHADRILTALRAATIGEYDIAGELGRGGMAVVFLAHDLSLNRKVAIKALLPELLYTEGMDLRFKHEARIAAKLDHPNILVIHGVREANDLLFIVMKLVEGLPLSTIAKVSAPLPIPVVRFIVRHVAEALAYAHGESVVHRDVKPANIMVDRRGNVVVMDFGIAKAADDAHLTRTGLVIGTPAYMSPEQCLAQGVSPASDQYSLGVVAFELLTGKTPFRGSALEMQWAHATATPPAVRSLRPDCPPQLEALVSRMLAKAPAERWPSLHDVASALGDDTVTAASARSTLVALANEAPSRRDATLPTTPASPLPFGAGPGAAIDATTDPVRRTSAGRPADGTSASVSRVPDAAVPSPAPPAAAHPGPTPTPAPPAASPLTLSQQRIALTVGDSVELIVELDATEAASDGNTVRWESDNRSVATVSSDGFVTAIAPGLAEIACTWRGKRAVCVVQVTTAVIALPVPAERRPPPNAESAVAGAGSESRAASVPDGDAARPRRRRRPWLVGGAAAALVGAVLLYNSISSGGSDVAVDASPPAPTVAEVATLPSPSSSPAAPASAEASAQQPAASGGSGTSDSAAGGGARTSVPPAPTPNAPAGAPQKAVADAPPNAPAPRVTSSTASASRTTGSATQTTPPVLPLARPDTTRLAANRADTTTGYGATRPAPPAAPTSGYPPAPRDSTPDHLPAPPRDVAVALFREFASTINSRTYSRITSAYSQPTDAADIKLWQEFLVFVRDYMPRATARSATVDSTTNPPTITASIDFRWSTDAGYERTRQATFVGYGLPIQDGWQLRGARLTKRFW